MNIIFIFFIIITIIMIIITAIMIVFTVTTFSIQSSKNTRVLLSLCILSTHPCLKLVIIHHIPKNKGKINFNCRNKKLTATCTCTTQFENL